MNAPLLIASHDGQRAFTLSREVYQITRSLRQWGRYRRGMKVRLIAGVGNRTRPGEHPDSKWRTVCRLRATAAEHIGIPKRALRRVN